MKADFLEKTATYDNVPLTHCLRAVCLLPGLTDIVDELGQSRKIVAHSHECSGRGEIITTSKLPPDVSVHSSVSSREISAGWRAITSRQALFGSDLTYQLKRLLCSFYITDIAKMGSTMPTVILTIVASPSTMLDPSVEEVVEAVKKTVPSVKEILSIDPCTLSEVYAAVNDIARVLECPQSGTLAVTKARYDLGAISDAMQKFVRSTKRQRIAVVQWADPIYLAGGWVPEVIDIGGGRAGEITRTGGPSISVTADYLLDHDIVIFAICAVELAGCRDICNKFLARHSKLWKNGRPKIIATDATILFSRPSLGAVTLSAEVVSEIVSGLATYGHRGSVWTVL